MKPRKHSRLTVVLLVGALVCTVSGQSVFGGTFIGAEHEWIVSMTQAVLMAQATEGDGGAAKYAPYLRRLQAVMGALERRDDRAAYTAMNRFMDMLEAREHGIAPELADWLLDYCYLVTPAKYHDVSRHIRKVTERLPREMIVQTSP
ncbi:MAG TPA: hypothetical protein VNK46_02580 [Nitrospiraceae bacterium]|jgi:hypothetical protein|nr:hypothetical protein [Nitrospiraceae bacterium]